MIDRTIQPQSKKIENITFPEIEHLTSGKVPLVLMPFYGLDTIKIDILFNAGSRYQQSPFIASLVNSMLQDGTSIHSSSQIAEKFDYYGAFINADADRDNAWVSLVCMRKFQQETIDLLFELLSIPSFPENMLDIQLKKNKERLLNELQKVKTLCTRKFMENLFGENHIYGRQLTLDDLDKVKREDLIRFHAEHYQPARILLSGEIDKTIHLPMLEKFSVINTYKPTQQKANYDVKPVKTEKIVKEDAVQSAIRIGRVMFNKKHEDYIPFTVLCTLLGGFFGSRLMQNIREEKGLTYGIGAYTISMHDTGYFVIATEVKTELVLTAIEEILMEVERLSNELVPLEELQLVKNFMLGDILRSTDGFFAQADLVRAIYDYDLDYAFYANNLEKLINEITPEIILNLAKKYLQKKDLHVVYAGK